MSKILSLWLIIIIFSCFQFYQRQSFELITTTGLNWDKDLVQKPFGGFIENCGQVIDVISYYFDQANLGIYFKESEIQFVNKAEKTTITIRFPGAAAVQPIGMKKTNHIVNYFLSNFHLTNVQTYDEIWYYDLYQGIDLRYYMDSLGLKYEFIVHPGGNPKQIAIQLNNPIILTVTPEKIKARTTSSNTIVFEDYNLYVYQADGITVGAQFHQYREMDRCYGFTIDNFDKNQDLIIDPVLISYSTYLGGDGDYEFGNNIAVDLAGNAYITGCSDSTDFPTQNPYQTDQGDRDVFVTKLNATGNGLVYSTYLGGSDSDRGTNIVVDLAGNAYITGWTDSTDFPTLNPYQTDQEGADVFVAKLNTTGNGLVYSTYLGGGFNEYGTGITVDLVGNTYITGRTYSSDFPILNSYQNSAQGDDELFVTKLNATGNGLVYSTYLGGSANDLEGKIAVDSAGNAYVTGYTDSTDFPTQNPYQTDQGGTDIFVTKLNATGNGLAYSTYLGGDNSELGRAIAVDSAGNAYVTGQTTSSNFPTLNSYQTYQGVCDVYVTKLNATGNGLIYSTYLGGSDYDRGWDIAVDSAGNTYIAGWTQSTDFPTLNPCQTDQWEDDIFVTKLNATGNGFVYSTYLGGDDGDNCLGIAVDSTGNAYVTGGTFSDDFPTLNPYQTSLQGGGAIPRDAFVTKMLPMMLPVVNIDSPTATMYATDIITVALSGDADHYWYFIAGEDDQNQSWTTNVDRTLADGTYTLHAYGNDSAGNKRHVSLSFTIDTTAPTVNIDSPTVTTYATDTITVALSGDADHYWYFIAGEDNHNQSWTTNVDRIITDETYSLHAYGNDSAGNEGHMSLSFTIDTTAPTVNIDSPTATTYATSTITVALSGDADYYWYFIEGEDSNNQSWTGNVDRTLADGSYTLYAYGNDSIGNEAHVSISFIIASSSSTVKTGSTTTTELSSTTNELSTTTIIEPSITPGWTFPVFLLSIIVLLLLRGYKPRYDGKNPPGTSS